MTALETRAVSIVLLAASALLLAGCAPTAPVAPGASEDNADTGSSEVATSKGPACEDNTSGIEIFAGEGVTNAPESGQVWGDGSELSFDYAGFIPGSTLGYDIGYVQDDGAVIPTTGGFFADPTGTTFASSDPYFNSTSEGYSGIVSVTMTNGDDLSTSEVANFCVTLAISE